MSGERTLRELDEAAGLPKGSAFRAFKQARGDFREGADFRVLDRVRDAAEVAALQAGQRAYHSSQAVVLAGPRMAARITEILRSAFPSAPRRG